MQTELIQKQYDFELDQRNTIASVTNIPIVAITIVASAASVALLDYRYQGEILTYLFALFIGLSILAIGFSVFYVFRSFWNYEYKKLASPALLRPHYNDLLKWHIEHGSAADVAKVKADDDFAEFIAERLSDAADWNGQNNIIRGNFLHQATAAVAFGVACLLPAAGLYIHNKTSGDEKVHQVRLVEPPTLSVKELPMSSKPTNASSPSAAPAPAPAPAPMPSAKPSGPPNSVFKGNTSLPKPNASSGTTKK
jgi:hypothetical protein